MLTQSYKDVKWRTNKTKRCRLKLGVYPKYCYLHTLLIENVYNLKIKFDFEIPSKLIKFLKNILILFEILRIEYFYINDLNQISTSWNECIEIKTDIYNYVNEINSNNEISVWMKNDYEENFEICILKDISIRIKNFYLRDLYKKNKVLKSFKFIIHLKKYITKVIEILNFKEKLDYIDKHLLYILNEALNPETEKDEFFYCLYKLSGEYYDKKNYFL